MSMTRSKNIKNKNFDYKSSIQDLKRIADDKRGVQYALKDGVLTRDATCAKKDLYSPQDYGQQIINIHRAATQIIEILKPKNSKDLIENITKTAKKRFDDYKSGTMQNCSEEAAILDLKKKNTGLVNFLKRNVIKEKSLDQINKLMRISEAYAGLSDDHFNIQTKIKIGDKEFIQKDEIIAELTDAQKKSFAHRKNEDWYNALSDIEKGLVEMHIDALTDGKHSISCIIRNIPGARNAYKKTLLQVDKDGGENVLTSYLHSGGIHTLSKDQNAKELIPEQNYQQLSKASGGKSLKFMTLCSELPFNINRISSGLDQDVVPQTKAATGPNFINLPINSSRWLASNNNSNCANEIFVKCKEKYPNAKMLHRYLDSQKNFFGLHDLGGIKKKQAIQDVAKMGHKDSAILKEIIELKHISVARSGFTGWLKDMRQSVSSAIFRSNKVCKNDSAKFSAMLVNAAYTIDPENTILISCKSGKDRTGIVSYYVDCKAILASNPDLKESDVQSALSNASHIQFLSSCAGGKTGCFGIKGVQMDGDRKSQENLVCKPAFYSSCLNLIEENFYKLSKAKGDKNNVNLISRTKIEEAKTNYTSQKLRDVNANSSVIDELTDEVLKEFDEINIKKAGNIKPEIFLPIKDQHRNETRGL